MRATRHKDCHRYCDLPKSALSRHSADETLNGVNDSRRLFAAMSDLSVRRDKAALSSGCKPHPQPLQQAANTATRHFPVVK